MHSMAYIIIHQNPKVSDDCIIKTINKHLRKGIYSIEEASCDPDFCIVQKEEKGNIKIEQIKNLQKKLLYTPFNKTHQFGIVKDAQLMTPEAQNALLKTLEECPEKTVLILTVNSETAVLQTILSRCTRIYPNETTEQKEKTKNSDIKTFLAKPIYEQINEIESITKEHKVEEFLNNLTEYYREIHKDKMIQNKCTQRETKILEMIKEAKYRITKNVNPKIALEYICFKINHN